MAEKPPLTEAQARAFGNFYIAGFAGFTGVATLAHLLVWWWRPWF